MFSSFSLPTFFFFFFFPVIRSRTPVAPLVNCVVSQKSWTANSEFAVSVCGSGDSEACSDDGFSGILAFSSFFLPRVRWWMFEGLIWHWDASEYVGNQRNTQREVSRRALFTRERTRGKTHPVPFIPPYTSAPKKKTHLKLECVFFFSTKLALTHV